MQSSLLQKGNTNEQVSHGGQRPSKRQDSLYQCSMLWQNGRKPTKLVKVERHQFKEKLNIDDYEDENQNKRSSVCIMADEISLGVDPASLAARKLDSDQEVGSPF